jgi:signal transduction histidine kinase
VSNPSPRLVWTRRLEARVAGGIGLLVAGSLAAVLAASTYTINTRSLEWAARDLAATRLAFEGLTGEHAEFASAQASLVVALPVFRAHMTDSRLSSDVASLEAMAEEYRRQLKADFVVITNEAGRWAAEVGWPKRHGGADRLRATIERALGGHSTRTTVHAGEQLFLTVSEPARFAEEIVGTLTAGFALNDAMASHLADFSQGEVNFLVDEHLYASSLTGPRRAAMQELVAKRRLDRSSSAPQAIGDGEYVAGWFRPSADSIEQVVLLHDWGPTRQIVSDLRSGLLGTGVFVFVLAIGAGVIVSRRMTRPLQELADAARDVAAGNLSRRVSAGGSAEASMMAEAFNDMTASLLRSREEVRKRDEQLLQSQKMEAMGRLAGGIAHDFNNLLTAIKGYGELLLVTFDESDRRHQDAAEIVTAADRATSLTRQLLAFSRRQVITPRVLGLDGIVKNTEQMLKRLIGEQIDLRSAVPTDVWPVHADPGQMEQVVMNLVVNARDAMPHGGSIAIQLANVPDGAEVRSTGPALASGPFVRLSVADTGCGMDAETVAHIFEPFFTTKAEGKGTGLGLATVYGIVEQAGGAIHIDTAPGRGTAFHIFLPRAVETPAST